jgi:MFS family permease
MPYTLTMLGFAAGGVIAGKLADRFGVTVSIIVSTLVLGAGYIAVGNAANLWQAAIAHGVLIGAGTSSTFAPLMADISHWFRRRRGIAVTIAASGNYVAGTIWPPLVQHFTAADGWRATYIGIGIFCVVTMLPLSLLLRRKIDAHHAAVASAEAAKRQAALCSRCCSLPASAAASPCRCRRCTSSPIAAISVMASPAAPTCCR